MEDIVYVLIFFGIYILVQAYILPKIGISTWMKDACQVTDTEKNQKKMPKKSWLYFEICR